MPPIETFFTEPTRFAASLNPDGTKVAYLGPDDSAIIGLYLVDVEHPEYPLRVSKVKGATVRCFFWIGNHELLWQCNGSDGGEKLHLSNLITGESRELLSEEKRFIRLQGVVDSAEPCILVGLSEAPSAFPDLFRVNLRSNAPPVLASPNPHQILTWTWDQQGTPVAGLRWTQTGAKELLNLSNDPPRVVFRAEPTDDLRLLMASPDGSKALVLTNRDSDLTHLEWVELNSGARSKLVTDPMNRVDLEGMLMANGEILAASYSDEALRWHVIAHGFSPTLRTLRKFVGSDSMTFLGVDQSMTRVLLKRFSSNNPGTVWLHNAKDSSTRLLWHERSDLKPSSLCETRPITYRAHDGSSIPAYLTLPTSGKAPWPLVMFPHGGPRMRTHSGFDGRVQFLASRGYAVLQPNFRGSRGYGKAFMNVGDGQWGKGVMQTDVTDGVDHLVRDGVVDPKRVAILGGSYGGYAALAGLAFTPDRYAAGVCLFGISDLIEHVAHHPTEWQAYAGETIRLIGDPSTAEGRKTLYDLSPVNHTKSFKAPLLIYHGERDKLIPASHTRRIVDALKRSDKEVVALIAPDEDHGFSNPESEMAVYRAIECFLHQQLGGQIGPPPRKSVIDRLTLLRERKDAGALHHTE